MAPKTIELLFAAEVSVHDADRAILGAIAQSMTDGAVALDTMGSEMDLLQAMTLRTTTFFDMDDCNARLLDAFCHKLCVRFEEANPTMVMWPAAFGNRPNWSQTDAAFLGRQSALDAPADGDPTFDDSVYQIECYAREDYYGRNPANPDREALRAAAKAEQEANKPKVEIVGRVAENEKALVVIFDRKITDEELHNFRCRVD